jgi:hypothetical protein
MSTLKRELIKRYTWRTRLDLELALVTYIGWYNARRRHLSLKHTADGRTRRQAPHQVLQRYNQQDGGATVEREKNQSFAASAGLSFPALSFFATTVALWKMAVKDSILKPRAPRLYR